MDIKTKRANRTHDWTTESFQAMLSFPPKDLDDAAKKVIPPRACSGWGRHGEDSMTESVQKAPVPRSQLLC